MRLSPPRGARRGNLLRAARMAVLGDRPGLRHLHPGGTARPPGGLEEEGDMPYGDKEPYITPGEVRSEVQALDADGRPAGRPGNDRVRRVHHVRRPLRYWLEHRDPAASGSRCGRSKPVPTTAVADADPYIQPALTDIKAATHPGVGAATACRARQRLLRSRTWSSSMPSTLTVSRGGTATAAS